MGIDVGPGRAYVGDMRAILGLMLAFSVGAGCAGELPGPDADGAAKLASPEGWCSAVPVGRRLVATAGHCAFLADDPDHAVDVPGEGRFSVVSTIPFGYDGVLLVLDGDLAGWTEVAEAPAVGSEATFVSARGVVHTCTMATLGSPIGARCFPESIPGDSGSPAYDAEGRVWGVLSTGLGAGTWFEPVARAVENARLLSL